MNDEVLASIEREIQLVPVPETRSAGPVERFLLAFKRTQENTAKNCLDLAQWFEDQARMLRERAALLNQQAVQIPEDIKNATSFEIETRESVQFLDGLRNPKTDT